MNNSENQVWNDLHGGNRVPINDSDIDGAPFNLNGNDPTWAAGSINKAVYETHVIEGTFDPDDEERAGDLNLDFLTLLRYINNDMLYGYKEDSRNTIPGDFMAFRAYPTATLSHNLTLIDADTLAPLNIDGTLSTNVNGTYIQFFYDLTTSYKMPYNIDFTATITIGGNTVYNDFVYRIAAGSNKITHYRDPSLDEEINGVEVQYWVGVSGGLFISLSSNGLSGDINCTVGNIIIAQEPFYGVLTDLSEIVSENDYNPIIPSPATSIGAPPFRGFIVPNSNTLDFSTASLFLARVEKCNEISQEEAFPRNLRNGRLYLKNTDTLQVGVKLYADNMSTVDAVRAPVEVGSYFWLSSHYTNGGQTIWKFTRYLIIDEHSIVTYLSEPGLGYLGDNCWVPNL